MREIVQKNFKHIIYSITILLVAIIVSNSFSYAATTETGEIYTRDELSELIHEINNELQTEKNDTNTDINSINSLISGIQSTNQTNINRIAVLESTALPVGINHSNDIYNIDLTSRLNTAVVNKVDEYIRYSKYGKLVVVDMGGIWFKSTGSMQLFFSIPEELRPANRTVSSISTELETNKQQSIVYNHPGDLIVYVHVPDISARYYGQMIWLTA